MSQTWKRRSLSDISTSAWGAWHHTYALGASRGVTWHLLDVRGTSRGVSWH